VLDAGVWFDLAGPGEAGEWVVRQPAAPSPPHQAPA
jgi:hypothetical protein